VIVDGAKAVGMVRLCLYVQVATSSAKGVLQLMHNEIEQDMKLMGCSCVDELTVNTLAL